MTTTNLSMSHDTILKNGAPTTNYDTDTELLVGEANFAAAIWRSLLRPDFSSIPAGQIFSAVTLKLTVTNDYSSNTRTMRCHRVLRDWVSNQATWNIFKTANNWTTAGCGSSGNDYAATELGSVSVDAVQVAGNVISISLDPVETQKLYDGTYTNDGLVLFMDTQTDDGMGYASKEHGTAGYRPVLEVVHAPSFIPHISGII